LDIQNWQKIKRAVPPAWYGFARTPPAERGVKDYALQGSEPVGLLPQGDFAVESTPEGHAAGRRAIAREKKISRTRVRENIFQIRRRD
jgi:hypothetical protein